MRTIGNSPNPLGGLLAKREKYVRLISYKIYKNTSATLNMATISHIPVVKCQRRFSLPVTDGAIRNAHGKWYDKREMDLK